MLRARIPLDDERAFAQSPPMHLLVAALAFAVAADSGPPAAVSPTPTTTAPVTTPVTTPVTDGSAMHEQAMSAPTLTSGETLTVAVLDLRASPGTEGIARALTTLVTNEIGSRPGWKAISRADLKQILAHQADSRLLGCEEAACTADVGKLANAKRVIFGSVEMAEGGAAVFSLTLVDTEGPTVLERVAYTWKSATDDMVDLARPAVDRLVFGKQAATLVGNVEILSPDGATVVMDDKELGTTPVKPVRDLGIGPHRIEVRKGGFLPWGKDVAVTQNETQVVQVDLVDETSVQPVYARWYVWGSALAGVVVIGGTAAAVGTYQYLSTPAKLVVGAAK